MESPLTKKPYLEMRKGEEFFLRNMVAPNRSGTEILHPTTAQLTKKLTKEIDKSREATQLSVAAGPGRSGQTYVRQQSFSRGDEQTPPANTNQLDAKKPMLSRTKTLDNIGTLLDDRDDAERYNKQRLAQIQEIVSPPDLIEPPRYGDASNSSRARFTTLKAPETPTTPKKEQSQARETSGVASLGMNHPLAEKSSKVDRILVEWEERLMRVDNKIMKDRSAREVLSADIRLLEDELRRTNLALAERESEVSGLEELLKEARESAGRVASSMDGLANVLEREGRNRRAKWTHGRSNSQDR